jgi:uncharacterized membrane protein YoaK (UPF0700 family)
MSLADAVSALPFRSAVWLYPLTTALHVVEEWPGFPVWARRFASPRYSDREYVVTHAITITLALLSAATLALVPKPALVFAFFAFVFGPGVLWNACFHLGATAGSRTYCPGAVTSAALYLPLGIWLARLAVRDGLLSPAFVATALGVALAAHMAEVGHNVFKRW